MKVVIIGSGNVATVLGAKILGAGHVITQVISRNYDNALTLARLLEAKPETDLLRIDPNSALYLLAVSDDSIGQVARQLHLPGKLVVHTAGSVGKNLLQSVSDQFGVLYPLQSLKKELDYIPPIPVIIDGSTEQSIDFLKTFASSWAASVSVAGDTQRLKLHLAAVVSSNFTNFLYSVAEDYCTSEGLPFAALQPLIQETSERLKRFSPRTVQTGPAVRGDQKTIERHLQLLDGHAELKRVYMQLTRDIINYYGKDISLRREE